MRALLAVALVLVIGCTGTTIVRVNPPDAAVAVDGTPLRQNWFEYGRWIGNAYHVTASAPGYQPKEVTAGVHLGSRCGLVAFYSIISVFGAPVALSCPWQGQMKDEITISLGKEVPR